MTIEEFTKLKYGMFVHFGLFSKLARGEWVMNREQLSVDEMKELAKTFNPVKFNANEICQLAVASGMKYIVFTTMHHDGFRLFDTKLSTHNSMQSCGRDLVAEMIDACRKHNLKIGLYHSLNNWFDQPDAVAALENPADYEKFIDATFARLKELVEKYKPFDIMWYDGWWPFDPAGWQAERMNAELRAIHPGLIFNGRNGLPGDFGTPEQHLNAPVPYRPWEACVTLNNSWGYVEGDDSWKHPLEVSNMLKTCVQNGGNLLLNVGPRGDGSIPEETIEIMQKVGSWLKNGGEEALTDCEPMPLTPTIASPKDRGDWDTQADFSCSGNNLFIIMKYHPAFYTLTGLKGNVRKITCMGQNIPFTQNGGKLSFTIPEDIRVTFRPTFKVECDAPPAIYRCGGLRVPNVEHPRYDPGEPDIEY
ncbi:MAG: alpha-L-fucosidase [Lentisphaeria bacterium]|nr:alpha-L-fucosidase [Lentisphaeria bacterium]